MIEPPQPPALPARSAITLTPEQTRLALLTLAGMGAALMLLSLFNWSIATAMLQLGAFLLTYAAVVSLSRLPPNRLGQRVDRFLEQQLQRGFTGFYGVMAIATFARLEVRDIASDIVDFELSTGQLVQSLVQGLIGFSIDSVMNVVWAALWPVKLLEGSGWFGMLVATALAWLVYRAGSQMFPDVHRRLDTPRKRRRGKAPSADQPHAGD